MDPIDPTTFLREFRAKMEELADDFKEAWEKVSDDVQYHFDKELGKQMSKHPELYAEVRKTYRQVKKGLDKMGKDLGLK